MTLTRPTWRLGAFELNDGVNCNVSSDPPPDLPPGEIEHGWREGTRMEGADPTCTVFKNRSPSLSLELLGGASGTTAGLLDNVASLLAECRKTTNTLYYKPGCAASGVTYDVVGAHLPHIPVDEIKLEQATTWDVTLEPQCKPFGLGDLTNLATAATGTLATPLDISVTGVPGDHPALARHYIRQPDILTDITDTIYFGRRANHHVDFVSVFDDDGDLTTGTITAVSGAYGGNVAQFSIGTTPTSVHEKTVYTNRHKGTYRALAVCRGTGGAASGWSAQLKLYNGTPVVYTGPSVALTKTGNYFELVDLGSLTIPAIPVWDGIDEVTHATKIAVYAVNTNTTGTFQIDFLWLCPTDGGFLRRPGYALGCLTVDGVSSLPGCYESATPDVASCRGIVPKPCLYPPFAVANNLSVLRIGIAGTGASDVLANLSAYQYRYRPRFYLFQP